MEYSRDKKEIKSDRKLSELDKFVLDFVSILDNYVIVSGYVSILFGRSRATEDIDLLIPSMDEDKFTKLWRKIYGANFECLNTYKIEEAFDMLNEHAIRFAKKGEAIPNIEFKIIKNDVDKYSFDNKINAVLKGGNLYISPIEMQIAYKLFLGSEKDIEDAKHLYVLFEEKLNKEELLNIIKEFKVEEKFKIIK